MSEIEIVLEDPIWATETVDPARRAHAAAEAALRHWLQAPPPAGAELAVVLADDATVRDLNRRFRGKDAPTNVLSFPAPEPPADLPDDGQPREIGDVILAVETLLAEAAAADTPPAHHFQHLLIHGVLHLIGYDHQTDAEAQAMEALETTLLARLGIADPYAAGKIG